VRYGIFADVHSNLEALEAVLQAIEKERVDQILCAGDMVGYGADPEPILRLLKRKAHPVVAGNHDWLVADRMDLDWFDKPAQEAALWTRTRLPEEERIYLGNLPLIWRDTQLTLAHGSIHEPDQFHYVLNLQTARASLQVQETPVAFIGHTHHPGVFTEEQGQISFSPSAHVSLRSGVKYLVNVGSVGQPRDGDPRAAWCLYDAAAQTVEIRRVSYPVEKVQAKIRQAGLPEFLAERLALGH